MEGAPEVTTEVTTEVPVDVTTEVTVTGVAAGGDGVGRLDDGRAVFVRGALPGERVSVTVVGEKARYARAGVVEVLAPAAGRVTPPCPLVAAGCGGCGWQHVDHALQRELKATVVGDALVRIGRFDPDAIPAIDPGPALSPTAYRTTVRAAVVDGRAALRSHHSHEPVELAGTGCLVAHPLVDEVLRTGRFGSVAKEVTVRAGAATGERLVLLDPAVGDADEIVVPEGVVVVGAQELAAGHRTWLHDDVAGRRWRVSAGSFFQARPDGAAALAEVVATAARSGLVDGARTVVDLYGGVGLLGGVLADRAGDPIHLQLVEANRSAVADARENLADLGDALKVVRADVRRWRPNAADVVIADPSRHGLGADVVDRIVATGAGTVVLVSCDPGALGRDAGLLAREGGYELASVTLVDLFPHTPHVEVVTRWRRPHPPGRSAP